MDFRMILNDNCYLGENVIFVYLGLLWRQLLVMDNSDSEDNDYCRELFNEKIPNDNQKNEN